MLFLKFIQRTVKSFAMNVSREDNTVLAKLSLKHTRMSTMMLFQENKYLMNKQKCCKCFDGIRTHNYMNQQIY